MGGYLFSAAWLLVAAVSVVYVCVRASGWLVPPQDLLLRALAGTVIGWAQIAGVLQVLGATHALYPGPVVAAHVALAIAAWRLLRPAERVAWGPPSLPALLAVAAGVGLIAYWTAYSLGAPSAEFDTNRYHIVNAAHWLTSHEAWSLPFAQPSDHTALEPGNGDVVSLWLMLPFGDDRLAYATNLGAAVLVLLAVATLVRELGGEAWTGAVAGIAVLTSPLVATAFPHSMLTDLWGSGGVVAAAGLGVVAARLRSGRVWTLAGVAAGLAAGTKFAELVPSLGVLVVLAFAFRAGRRSTLFALAGAFASCVFWYVRNAVATGNPVYPLPLRIAGRTFAAGDDSPVNVSRVSLLGQLTSGHRQVLSVLADVLSTSVSGVVLLVLGGALVVAVRRLRRQRASLPVDAVHRRRSWILVACLVCVAAYAAGPYSGGGDPPAPQYINASLRFLLPGLILAAAWAAAVLPPPVTVAIAFIGFATRADLIAQGQNTRTDLSFRPLAAVLALVCVLAVVAAGLLVSRTRWRAAARPRWALTIAPPAMLALAAIAPAVGSDVMASVVQGTPSSGCACVVLVSVADVRAVLAPTFSLPIRSVGIGDTEGARREILDAQGLQAAIEAMRPVAVIVGGDAPPVPRPPWSPPGTWRVLGHVGDAIAYVPTG